MKQILFFGDYYPYLSNDSLRNDVITKKLSRDGYSVSLISDAWCTVDKYSFVNFLPKESPHIENVFYADPVQSQYSNTQTALIALASLVCSNSEVNYLFVSNFQKYGLIAEAVSSYFEVPIITSFYSHNSIYALYETYSKAWFERYISKSELLLTFVHHAQLFNKYTDLTAIEDIYPYEYKANDNFIDYNNTVVFGSVPNSLSSYLSRRIKELECDSKLYLLIWGEKTSEVCKKVKETREIELFTMNNGLGFIDALAGSIVFCTNLLLFDTAPLAEQAILLLNLGAYPVINNKTKLLLENYYIPKISKFTNELYILTDLTSPADFAKINTSNILYGNK